MRLCKVTTPSRHGAGADARQTVPRARSRPGGPTIESIRATLTADLELIVAAPSDGGSREAGRGGDAGQLLGGMLGVPAEPGLHPGWCFQGFQHHSVRPASCTSSVCRHPLYSLPAIYTYNVLGINSEGGHNATFSQLGVLLTGNRVRCTLCAVQRRPGAVPRSPPAPLPGNHPH